MVSRHQCSCGLPITQVSTQPSLALLFHWKPFYEQFAASSMYKFQQEEHGGGGSRGLFHQQFLAPQKWREERTSLGSGEEFLPLEPPFGSLPPPDFPPPLPNLPFPLAFAGTAILSNSSRLTKTCSKAQVVLPFSPMGAGQA